MNNNQSKKHYSADIKYKIVKEALTTDQSVTEICKKYEISVSMFYRWQEQFLLSAKSGMSKASKGEKPQDAAVSKQEAEITRLKNVIAEITAENIEFKKKFSE